MLTHFSSQQPLFPRRISTATTHRRQYQVYDKDMTMLYFQGALWEDCRIAGYGVNQTNPDLIFIELDASDFASIRSFKLALTSTLKNIKVKIDGHPSVIWSGRGYHIIQPISCPLDLDKEEEKKFAALTYNSSDNNLSNKFLQFAERYLSANKCDKGHHPAIKSCMLRIPGSLNSKCKAAGIDAEVKIIQKWDGCRPDYRLLIGSFYADLIGQQRRVVARGDGNNATRGPNEPNAITWIEQLLQTPIVDYRKHARDLIIIPFLVLYRGITDRNLIYDIVMSWADKCNELRALEPSKRDFSVRVRSRIEEVMRDKVPPMRVETLKEKNPQLYQTLNL